MSRSTRQSTPEATSDEPRVNLYGDGSEGEAGGIRTRDLRIKSPLLYRLSYSLSFGKSFTELGFRTILERGF
jgi:hypothetical protein